MGRAEAGKKGAEKDEEEKRCLQLASLDGIVAAIRAVTCLILAILSPCIYLSLPFVLAHPAMNAYRREVAVHEQLVQRVRTVHLQETAGHVSERKRE